MYKFSSQSISTKQRKKINELIITQCKAQLTSPLTKEEIFNYYTGLGGLHTIEQGSMSMSEFIKKKREFDMGQYFTSPYTIETIVDILGVEKNAKVLDPTCGHGVVANFVNNFTGVEYDENNVAVAKHLFPNANITQGNTKYFKPTEKFDYVISNPPFNFRWFDKTSQFFIINKSTEWLKEGGFLAIILPDSYLKDEFYFKSNLKFINENLNFVGSCVFEDAFKTYNLKYPTKVLFFQNTNGAKFHQTHSPTDEIKKSIKRLKANFKRESIQNLNSYSFSFKNPDNSLLEDEFEFICKKYLYEIKTHKGEKVYNKAVKLINKFVTQVRPIGMEDEEWSKVRLTEKKVISNLKRQVSSTGGKKKKRTGTRYTTKLKDIQRAKFEDINPSEAILSYFKDFKFNNDSGTHQLTDIQLEDVVKASYKDYLILNWEQGVGKTVGAYALLKYWNKEKNIIIAPAQVIKTWMMFLKQNNEQYVLYNNLLKLNNDSKFILISYSTFSRKNKKYLFKKLRGYLKQYSHSVVLDEGDNICNMSSNTTKRVLSTFRSGPDKKILATGTLIRNNLQELYAEMLFLFNNSAYFVDNNQHCYKETKEGIVKLLNDNCGGLYTAKHGYAQFKSNHCPVKTSVFGISKYDQSIYNYENVKDILLRTSLIRSFKEVCGDKYKIEHKLLQPTAEEKQFFEIIETEFEKIVYDYYNKFDNDRKNSGLKIIRQLQTLIAATSYPQKFKEYKGIGCTKYSFFEKECERLNNTYLAIGATRKDVVELYYNKLKNKFPNRKIYKIDGDVAIEKRYSLLKDYENSENGILVCTQQSLASGLNIPFVDEVYVESPQWNFSRISQWFFRFIRLTSLNYTNVTFITLADTIENNLIGLLIDKLKVSKLIKLEEIDDVLGEYGFNKSILDKLITKIVEKEGKKKLGWGKAKVK